MAEFGFRAKPEAKKPAPLDPVIGDPTVGNPPVDDASTIIPITPSNPNPPPVDSDPGYAGPPLTDVPIEQPKIPEYRPPATPPPATTPQPVAPIYVKPIETGEIGATVMSYGYNPTTNEYSISKGGGQGFPPGFESAMNPEELYKKYPQIQGVFDVKETIYDDPSKPIFDDPVDPPYLSPFPPLNEVPPTGPTPILTPLPPPPKPEPKPVLGAGKGGKYGYGGYYTQGKDDQGEPMGYNVYVSYHSPGINPGVNGSFTDSGWEFYNRDRSPRK
jgi:hypothetical protein